MLARVSAVLSLPARARGFRSCARACFPFRAYTYAFFGCEAGTPQNARGSHRNASAFRVAPSAYPDTLTFCRRGRSPVSVHRTFQRPSPVSWVGVATPIPIPPFCVRPGATGAAPWGLSILLTDPIVVWYTSFMWDRHPLPPLTYRHLSDPAVLVERQIILDNRILEQKQSEAYRVIARTRKQVQRYAR